MAERFLLHYEEKSELFSSKPVHHPPARLSIISEPCHHASSYIPHSTGLDFPEWHRQLSSTEYRYQRQNRTQSFFQRYPAQTCIHSCCLVLQQTLPPGQSSGCEVGQKSERKDCEIAGVSHNVFINVFVNATEMRDLPPNKKHST